MPDKIVIHTEEQLELVAKQGFHILKKFYEAESKYHTHFGHTNRLNYLYWKERAKDFLLNPGGKIVFKENSEIILEKS